MTKSGKLDKRTRIGRALQPLIEECKELNEAQIESPPQNVPNLKQVQVKEKPVESKKLESKVIQREPPASIVIPSSTKQVIE